MRSLLIRLLIVGLFAAGVAHYAIRAWGPPYTPKYYAVSTGQSLQGPESDGVHGKFLYARRNIYLPQRPNHAWLQVTGRDRITVYVNGERAGIDGQIHPWAPAALMLDLTPFMIEGKNVIAVSTQQYTQLQPTILSIEGGYELGGQQHKISTDDEWRCSHAFDRGKSWWFSTEFDDRKWQPVKLTDERLAGQVYIPPRSVSQPRDAKWITTERLEGKIASLRREFNIDARPIGGWIRLAATSPYRLAVNGVLVDTQEEDIALPRSGFPVERTYDITPALRRGENSIAVQMTTPGELPHLWVDAEVEDATGNRQSLDTGKAWLAIGKLSPDWMSAERAETSDVAVAEVWRPAVVGIGNLGMNPRQFEHEFVHIVWPDSFLAWHWGMEIGLSLLLAALTWFACREVSVWLAGGDPERLSPYLAYLALVIPAAALWGGIYSTYDPRVSTQTIYQPQWVLLALAAVPLQWLLLKLRASQPAETTAKLSPTLDAPAEATPKLGPLSYAAWAVLVLVVIGAGLRVRHINLEPIHHDEVSAYWFTRGILETGFPGGEVAKDIPYGYAATSELAFYTNAIVGLFVEDPVLVLRIPTVLFSIATIPLMYFVGSRLFSPMVGLIAAAMYTFSPYCIEMSNFGRYFAQLQFFTILTRF
jgi:hypothetical protein